MAHSHDHQHDQSAYYTEQLCTIGICGALGGIAVILYMRGTLVNLLAAGLLQVSVLVGGIAVLALVLIRAIALWSAAGRPAPAHAHDHTHEHDCCDHDHDHAHEHHHHEHDHAHDHGHDHSHGGDGHSHDHTWAPMRYLVLCIPILIYFFVPLDALSARGGYAGVVDPSAGFIDSKGFMGELGFKELEGVEKNEELRNYYQGKIAQITGQFVPSPSERWFSLVRMKIRCCAADAVALPAVVIIDDSEVKDLPPEERLPNATALNRKWVQVTCQIQFRKRPDQPNEWMTVLVVRPTKEKQLTELIKQVPPDPNPYL